MKPEKCISTGIVLGFSLFSFTAVYANNGIPIITPMDVTVKAIDATVEAMDATVEAMNVTVEAMKNITYYPATKDDPDSDGVVTAQDNCPDVFNPAQINLCDPDADDDKDGIPNVWEIKYGLNPKDASDATKDLDGDGVSNLDEYKQGTDPKVVNTNTKIDIAISTPTLVGELKEKATYTLTTRVNNLGNNSASGQVEIYRSKDQTRGGSDDTKIATLRFNKIAATASQTLSNTKMVLPEAGDYWFYAYVVPLTGETNKANNYSPLRKVTVLASAAKHQVVSVKSCTPASPDATVSCTVQYTTSTADNTLTGLGLRLHYASQALTLVSIDPVLQTSLLSYDKAPLLDSRDDDKKAITDQYLGFQWNDATHGKWPNKPLATDLLTVTFKVNKDLKVDDSTTLGFSASTTASGYLFSTQPYTLKIDSGCRLDIDNNGEAKALTDGLLVLRYLFEFNGETLINNAVAKNAKRKTATDIERYLVNCKAAFDIDNSGETKALTDGLLILRYLFDFRGDTLLQSAVAKNAKRKTAKAIEAYLDKLKK